MNQRIWIRRLTASALCCCLLLTALFSAMAATTYPYETTCYENVNMRKDARGTSVVLRRIEAGEPVTILGVSGSYYKLEAQNATGFALIEYVDGLSTGAEIIPVLSGMQAAPPAVTKYPYDTNTIASVKFRKTASDDADVFARIPQDAIVRVQGVEANGYAKVRYEGKTGFVNSGFLVLANIPLPTPVPTPTPDPAAAKYEPLEMGSTGELVRSLQEALIELTYLTGTADAKFGALTKTAVNAFKKRNGMETDGIADGVMQKLIYEGTPKNPQGYRKNLKTLPPIGEVVIAPGDRGEPVEKLQSRLKELGYYKGELTRENDKDTVAAIKKFQDKHFLKQTGTADAQTQNLLYGALALSAASMVTPTPVPTVAPPKGTVRQGDKGDDAQAVQQRLKDLGYYTGRITGTFNTASMEALKVFQGKTGLKQDGVCGESTRAALWSENVIYAVPTAIPFQPLTTPEPLTPENVMIIMAGSRGNPVLNLQVRLTELGYYVSRQDGVYLEDDISAVRAFQNANGLMVNGTADYETQAALYSQLAIRAAANDTGSISETLRYGDEGSEVTALQNRLIELGYLTETADGKFGLMTKTAVMEFQKNNKLKRDGVAGSMTQAALFASDAAKSSVDSLTTLREGSVNSAVRDLQNRLIALGYLTGKADGKFGPKTGMALMEFQKRNNLVADGVAGKKTLSIINSSTVKQAAEGETEAVPTALQLTAAPHAASVRYANWYSEVKARSKQYPNVTIYDFITGISWQVHLFSFGAHADGEPITAVDTANMNRAFGGKTTWTPKPVWVILSDGTVYLASTHNTPHETSHSRTNDFAGHLCVHFPRTMAQVEAIGPYATSHQKTIDKAWDLVQSLVRR